MENQTEIKKINGGGYVAIYNKKEKYETENLIEAAKWLEEKKEENGNISEN